MKQIRILGTFIFVLASVTAHADPIRITSGFASFYLGDLGGFSLQGDNLTAGGVTTGGFLNAFAPGQLVDFSGGSGLRTGGSVSFNGQVGQSLIGFMNYMAVPFVAPPPGTQSVFTTPFTASGHLDIYADLFVRDYLFSVDFVGQGFITAGPYRLINTPDPLYFNPGVGLATLTFEPSNSAPVPEPSTCVLLGTGLLAIGRHVWRRTARRAS